MDSIRKLGYKVETKPVTQRKRRKSDLVMMWQSIWDITITISLELWMLLLGLWNALKFYLNMDDQQEVRKWLSNYIPHVPDDFAESWRDGILLSILLNKLQPGCFPDADSLDTNFVLRNLYRVFQLLEYHFNISPKFTVEEIITCSNGSDSKLLELLLKLKNETDTRVDEIKPTISITEERKDDKSLESETSTNCVARGTGLMVSFVGRAANFIVFFASISDLDLVVEIKGPCGTKCTERITKNSPKKKQILKPWKPASPHNVPRSSSNEDRNSYVTKKDSSTSNEDETRYMPMEYEVHSNRIYFAYMPLVKGNHQIKILSQGMHVSDSPYTVTIGPVVGVHKNIEVGCLKSTLKVEKDSDQVEPKKASVRFQEPNERKERLGKIIKRRVLRYIVKIDNKDVVVDTDSIDNLATSLLKMDYEFQKPTLSRRNSWGFVGDAERKVSVIRQFCVNMDELEAQSVKLHRSHSLSGSSKRAFDRTGSYECEDILQQKKLETVIEGVTCHFDSTAFRNREDEEALAYFNEDFENNTEYSKDDEECLDADDKIIYNPKHIRNSIEDFIEDHKTVNDFSDDQNLSPRFNAKETSNFFRDEAKISIEMDDCKQPPDHLTSASEFSGRYGKRNDNEAIFTNKSDRISNTQLNASNVNEKEKPEIIIMNAKHNCEIDYITLIEDMILTEENNIFTDTTKTIAPCGQTMHKQECIEIPEEYDISEETFIKETPCIKTDIKPVNQILLNSQKISEPFRTQKTFSGKRDDYSKLFKDISGKRSCSRQLKNILFPKTKEYKKRLKHQKYPNQKLSRPIFDLYSYSNQSNNSSTNIGEYSSKVHSEFSKANAKIKNASLPTYQNNAQAKRSETSSFGHDLKYSHFSNSEKSFQPNHSEFLVNNLKVDNKQNRLDIRINNANESKLASQFSAKIGNFPRDTNLNKKYSLTNSLSDESGIQISSPHQIDGHGSDNNSQQNFSNKSTRTPVAFSQLNFKHFNPTIPNKRASLVKNRINQWEKQNFSGDLSSGSRNDYQSESKSINITSRLKFWETVTKGNTFEQRFPKVKNRISKDAEEDVPDTTQLILTGLNMEVNNKEKATSRLDEEFSVFRTKLDDKLSSSLIFPKTRRSASDPGTLEVCIQDSSCNNTQGESKPHAGHQIAERAAKPDDPHTSSRESMAQMGNQTSSAEYPSSSSLFDNSIDYDGGSSAELLDSTEDEYIDDEISESASTYWGDLSVLERLKAADVNDYRDLCRIVDADFWRHEEDFVPPRAVECQVFGIAVYFGYVAVKNRFQVLTKGAGCGNLSATLQGFGHHDVSHVSVRYTQKDVYEVIYQVMSPGLYLISVRWMENPIVGSPFLCKVTF